MTKWRIYALRVALSSLLLFAVATAFAQPSVSTGSTPTSAQTGAQAQTGSPPADSQVTVKVFEIIVNALTPILLGFITAFINSRVKNQQMATLLSNAVQNSIGVVQQQLVKSVGSKGTITFDANDPDVRQAITDGAKYVDDHAKEAQDYFKISPAAVEQKIVAKLGLAAIATNLAETASSAPVVAGPLSPVPLTGRIPTPASA